jgi:hypothetical protein
MALARIDWDSALLELKELWESEGISIKWKSESFLNRVIGLLLKPINPRYMSGVVTTIGSTVYWPKGRWDSSDPMRRFQTMAHEMQHVFDSRKHWLTFGPSYLMPQIFALLSLLSFGAFWDLSYLWSLLTLLLLIPGIPSPRESWELSAYLINYSVKVLQARGHLTREIDRLAKIFVSPSYYWMAGFSGDEYIKRVMLTTGDQVLNKESTGRKWLDRVVLIVRSHTH